MTFTGIFYTILDIPLYPHYFFFNIFFAMVFIVKNIHPKFLLLLVGCVFVLNSIIIIQNFHSYIQEYPRITPVAYTAFRLNHYGVNGFMRNHTDNIYKSHGQKYGYPHLTSLIFLNDTYEGGEFLMCDSQYKYKLSQGSVIVFPSNFMFDHEVAKVTKGDRYTCMTWIM